MKIVNHFVVKNKKYKELAPGDVFALDVLSGYLYMKIVCANNAESVCLNTARIISLKPDATVTPNEGEFIIKSGEGLKYEPKA